MDVSVRVGLVLLQDVLEVAAVVAVLPGQVVREVDFHGEPVVDLLQDLFAGFGQRIHFIVR